MVRPIKGISIQIQRKVRQMDEFGFAKWLIARDCNVSIEQVRSILAGKVPMAQLVTTARRSVENHQYLVGNAINAMRKARDAGQALVVKANWCDVIPEWREDWEQSNGK